MSKKIHAAPNRFRRAFIALAVLSIIAMVAVGAVAFAGAAAPGILALDTAILIASGILITMAVIVPMTLFALGRAARMADQEIAESHAEAEQFAHDAKQRIDTEIRSNARMHEQDRAAVATLEAELKEVAEAAATAPTVGAAIAAKQTTKEVAALEQHMHHEVIQVETQADSHFDRLERQIAEGAKSHALMHADEAEANARAREEEMAALTQELANGQDALEGRLDALDASVARGALSNEGLRSEIDALREEMARQSRTFDAKLNAWTAPEGQMRAWANRVQETVDHDLKRINHRLRTRIQAFEEREHAALAETSAKHHVDAVKIAEEMVQHGMQDLDSAQEERLSTFKGWLDEQFAAFLAGQQAREVEAEERLAAFGATRGIRVDEHQHFTLTSHAPFGRVYPAHDIEGIGNKTSYALAKMGILDTEHLWHADTEALANELGIVPRQVRQWQSQAELMAIHGIGRQHSELLVRCGITSVRHLASLRPRELLDALERNGASRDASIQRGRVGPSKAEEFIRLAKEHNPTKAIYV